MQRVRLVGTAHRPLLEIIEQLGDHELDFPDHNSIAMLQRLLWHEAWMHAAHDDGYTLLAKLAGDFVAAVDVTRHRGNSNEVRPQIEIDRLDVLVRKHHSRGMAKLAVRHGRQCANESKWRRPVVDAIRFLAGRQRQRRAIIRRAQLLLRAWNETSIIETI